MSYIRIALLDVSSHRVQFIILTVSEQIEKLTRWTLEETLYLCEAAKVACKRRSVQRALGTTRYHWSVEGEEMQGKVRSSGKSFVSLDINQKQKQHHNRNIQAGNNAAIDKPKMNLIRVGSYTISTSISAQQQYCRRHRSPQLERLNQKWECKRKKQIWTSMVQEIRTIRQEKRLHCCGYYATSRITNWTMGDRSNVWSPEWSNWSASSSANFSFLDIYPCNETKKKTRLKESRQEAAQEKLRSSTKHSWTEVIRQIAREGRSFVNIPTRVRLLCRRRHGPCRWRLDHP